MGCVGRDIFVPHSALHPERADRGRLTAVLRAVRAEHEPVVAGLELVRVPGDERERRAGDLDPVGTARPGAGPRRRGRLRDLVTRLIGTEGSRAPTISFSVSRGLGRSEPPRRPARSFGSFVKSEAHDVLRYIATR